MMPQVTRSALFQFWFTFASPVSPRQYLTHGAALMVTKYLSDVALVYLAVQRLWTPFDYLSSVISLQQTTLANAPSWLLPVLGLWALPFIWAGITLSVRRCIDAAISPWYSLLFFVPYLNYTLMAALCAMPSRYDGAFADQPPQARVAAPGYLMAMLPGLVLGVVMILLTVYWRDSYGGALFFFTPFGIGAISAFALNRRSLATPRQTRQIVLLTLGLLGFLLIVFGREGAVCIAMAIPLAVLLGLMGAKVGREIAIVMYGSTGSFRAAGMGMLALPAAAFLEPTGATGVMLHEVRSSVVIAAAPMVVWSQVIAFPPMAEPTAWYFKLGVAYPKFARIEGSGVGAIRYCEFSTGPFVEPITIWEPGKRLAFNVSSAPVPLRELTPFDNVKPPHLDGFLESRRGEFRLIALPNGQTRLEGSTWYTVKMGPEGYWQLFGDYIIHQIHLRVLEHIRVQAESGMVRTAVVNVDGRQRLTAGFQTATPTRESAVP